MIDLITRKIFIVMLFVFLSLFFMGSSARISQWTNPQKNQLARNDQNVPRGPNSIHNPITAWTDSLQNIHARINHDVPEGPSPIGNLVSTWIDPLQNDRARIKVDFFLEFQPH